ncbi:hypothetical protein [Costertonia aggregata]|uniref:DUF4179 domain-containing protein n=1 Tax=Costertonia aggregata TaxID=343403 RepID=A0A7H9AS78_9FLAO|nr:hypothetical protein [Costertonia aggregata]QLG46351.1 hypothetical protein HYG79_13670 [Costertonia aggregata]
MAQDLREMFKKERKKQDYDLAKGHEQRFLKRLNIELPSKKKSKFPILKIAAAVLALMGSGWLAHEIFQEEPQKNTLVNTQTKTEEKKGISFGDLSPDLKKVEDYYVANINLELSQLEISQDNKTLVDSFMERLDELNIEYAKLNDELNEIGPNDQTISALIKNLQLRLQLLQKLKKKLNELKTSKNEQII